MVCLHQAGSLMPKAVPRHCHELVRDKHRQRWWPRREGRDPPPFLRVKARKGTPASTQVGDEALSGRGGPGAREHPGCTSGVPQRWTDRQLLCPSCLHPVTWGGTLLMPLFSALQER